MANGSPQVRRDDLRETDSAGFDWEEIDNPTTPTDLEHLVAPPKPAVQVHVYTDCWIYCIKAKYT
jgi:hypothetical protein